ncbi:MAG: hypothetical protein AAGD96_16065 [Chloroflexota bacterium]
MIFEGAKFKSVMANKNLQIVVEKILDSWEVYNQLSLTHSHTEILGKIDEVILGAYFCEKPEHFEVIVSMAFSKFYARGGIPARDCSDISMLLFEELIAKEKLWLSNRSHRHSDLD